MLNKRTHQNARKLFFLHNWQTMVSSRRRMKVLCSLGLVLVLLNACLSLRALFLPRTSALSLLLFTCWLLCSAGLYANSTLIQELFYAVKGTCDRKWGGRDRTKWEGKKYCLLHFIKQTLVLKNKTDQWR